MGALAMAKKQNPFMAHILSTWPQSLLGEDYLKGEEYDTFVAELVRRRDACTDDLTPDEREKAEGDYREYVNQFIQSNFKLILHEAKKYASRLSPDKWDDLVSECVLGFRRSLTTYDPKKAKISVHAPSWIWHYVQRFVVQNTLIHVPAKKWDKGQGFSESNMIYLDVPIGSDTDTTWELPDCESVTTEEAIYQSEIAELIADNLHVLNVKERDVIRRRYGIANGNDESMQEIADGWGLTRSRIGQIQKKALAKLRSAMTSKKKVQTYHLNQTDKKISTEKCEQNQLHQLVKVVERDWHGEATLRICIKETGKKTPCAICGGIIARSQFYYEWDFKNAAHQPCIDGENSAVPENVTVSSLARRYLGPSGVSGKCPLGELLRNSDYSNEPKKGECMVGNSPAGEVYAGFELRKCRKAQFLCDFCRQVIPEGSLYYDSPGGKNRRRAHQNCVDKGEPPPFIDTSSTQLKTFSATDLALGIVSDLVSAGHMESHDKTSILEVVQVVIASIEANMPGHNQ